MQTKKHNTYFWISFSDFMMALFFSFLVLFIVFFDKFEKDKKKLKTEAEKFKIIEQVIEATKRLKGDWFEYNDQLRKYYLKKEIYFNVNSNEIPEINKSDLIEAGHHLQKIIKEITENNKRENFKIKYLLIIEGLSSKNDGGSLEYNYKLSYLRALSIFKFWEENGITFDNDVIESVITGSGWSGTLRKGEETKNRTIYIQLVPLPESK